MSLSKMIPQTTVLAALCLALVAVASHAEESPAPAPVAAPTPAPKSASSADPIDSLDAAQLQQTIEILRRDHVRGAQIDELGMTRATLAGLLERLAPGASFGGEVPPPSAPSPFRSEILDDRAGYVRLGSLQSENITQLDAALRDFSTKNLHGVVLDLRATPASSDFALAAQVAGRFCPAGSALFTLTGPSKQGEGGFVAEGEPLYRGPLVVLINEDTAEAAEALAATLRWNAKAMLVGTRSSGRCVEFSDVAIGDQRLRLAVAEALIAGQSVYPRGLRPDIEVAQDPDERQEILAASLKDGAGVYVFEKERVRLNEASLVAGTNPELESEPAQSGLIDRPLQRAVDLVTAIRIFRKPG